MMDFVGVVMQWFGDEFEVVWNFVVDELFCKMCQQFFFVDVFYSVDDVVYVVVEIFVW